MKNKSFSYVINNTNKYTESLDLYAAALAFRLFIVVSDMSMIGLRPDINIMQGAARALEFMAPDEFDATC